MGKNVLEIISSMGDGGAETLVKDYCIILKKRKIPVMVLTVYGVSGTSNMVQLLKEGVTVESIFPRNSIFYKFLKHTLGFIYVPYRISRIVKKHEISCIHVHLNQLHHVIPISRRLYKVKLLYTCHNTPEKYFSGISGKMEWDAVRRLSRNSNFKLIALHEEMAEQLSEMFNMKHVEIIRNGIDFSRFTNVVITKNEKRKELGIPEGAFVIGHVGRFFEQKNHKMIVEIFKCLCQRNDKAFLLLIGEGPLENEIRERLASFASQEKFLILSRRSDIPEVMKAMDIFLFPSLYEGLPVSLIEAQVSKLPCVVSDAINRSAILLPTTIPLSLNDSVERWVDMIMMDFPEVNFTPAVDQYDMNKEVARLLSLYES